MGRLFAGTPWDRPPICDRCGELESACRCPPIPPEPTRIPPEKQTARIRVEKRPRGKLVTVISGLDPAGNDLPSLTTTLKNQCGTGGTAKDDAIELQGDHRERAESALKAIGFRVRNG